MKALSSMQLFLEQSVSYLASCWALPMAAPVCQPIWIWVAEGSMALGALFLLWFAWQVISYVFKYRAALRAEAARNMVADEATMSRHKWTGDKATQQGPADADVATLIRDEIARRKLVERGMIPPGPKR